MASVTLYQKSVTRNGKTAKSKTWRLRYKDPRTGDLVDHATGTRNKSVVKSIKTELEHRLATGAWGMITPAKIQLIRWSDSVVEYLEIVRVDSRPRTAEEYAISLGHFQRITEDPYLHDIAEKTLERFKVARSLEKRGAAQARAVAKRRAERGSKKKPKKDTSKPISVGTLNKDLRAVRALLKWAANTPKYIPKCPSFEDIMVTEDTKAPVVVERSIRSKLLAALDQEGLDVRYQTPGWYRVCFQIIADTGCRRGEIVPGLNWDAINWRQKLITVHAHTSKGRKARIIPMTDDLVAELRKWRSTCGDPGGDEPVLPWTKSTIRPFYDDWAAIVAAAGLPKGTKPVPKHFRSTCGSELIASGTPTMTVKDWLGHSSVETTAKFYLNTSVKTLREANERRAIQAAEEAKEEAAEAQKVKEDGEAPESQEEG